VSGLVDTHIHLLGHRDREATEATIHSFLTAAEAAGLSLIGFSDHEEYLELMRPALIRATARAYPHLTVLVGCEAEYRPGEEQRLRALSEQGFDYLIGSVHEIDGWAFDRPEAAEKHSTLPADIYYEKYFALVAQAAETGFFKFLGHIDLIKIYGLVPTRPPVELTAAMLSRIAATGVGIEINTNGFYKPVQEFYPSREISDAAINMGIPFTTGSDAHSAEIVGRDIATVSTYLKRRGARAVFPECPWA
jgi:histidinol-phosphatase (PHP family)